MISEGVNNGGGSAYNLGFLEIWDLLSEEEPPFKAVGLGQIWVLLQWREEAMGKGGGRNEKNKVSTLKDDKRVKELIKDMCFELFTSNQKRNKTLLTTRIPPLNFILLFNNNGATKNESQSSRFTHRFYSLTSLSSYHLSLFNDII